MALDWLAVVGAAAWTVPIFGWIKKAVTKPELQIFTASAPEIGFSMSGPICNIRTALSVRYKEIVITKIGIRLTHESGSSHEFEWRGMTQTMGLMRSPQGHIPFERESEVLALKVLPNAVEERFIRCQEVGFLKGKSPLFTKATKKLIYDRNNGTDTSEFLKSREMSDVYEFTSQYFFWRPGVYKLQFKVESPEQFSLLNDKHQFILSDHHVSELEMNRSKIVEAWQWDNLHPNDKNGMPMNWAYPEMQKIS